MKEGDLVQLSSYGNKLRCLESYKGCIGMLSMQLPAEDFKLNLRVDWFVGGKVKRERHTRKDLKKVKK